jgi:hypothetical protein
LEKKTECGKGFDQPWRLRNPVRQTGLQKPPQQSFDSAHRGQKEIDNQR